MLWKLYGPQRRLSVGFHIWKEIVVDEKDLKVKKAAEDLLVQLAEARTAEQEARDALTLDKDEVRQELAHQLESFHAERESHKNILESSMKGMDELREQLDAARAAEDAARS